jgi:CII-binding regulator of phage lambda lysogenization HflD
MSEQELKVLLSTYQQKSFDLFNQVVALEARLSTSNNLIEALTNKVNELNEEIEKLKIKTKRNIKTNEEETF